MGTSAGSKGSPSGVPLVPDWVPDVTTLPPPPEKPPKDEPKTEVTTDEEPDGPKEKPSQKEVSPSEGQPHASTDAPRGRYGPARSSIGKFGTTGSRDSLRSALGHFVSKGMGGAGGAARRMGGSSIAAGRTYEVISSLRNNTSDKSGLSPKDLKNCSTKEAKDKIIEAIQPIDGSQDTESVRESLNQAFGELLEIHEEASLNNLTEEQFDILMSSYIAHEIHSHLMREIGETLLQKGGAAGTERSNDVLDYIKAEVERVYSSFETRPSNDREAAGIANSVLEKTYSIFEAYIQ